MLRHMVAVREIGIYRFNDEARMTRLRCATARQANEELMLVLMLIIVVGYRGMGPEASVCLAKATRRCLTRNFEIAQSSRRRTIRCETPRSQ